MPLIGTRGAVSANALGLFSSGGSNWLSTYATPQLNAAGYSIACDSNGNLYAGGIDFIGANTVVQISKINSFGALLWQKNIAVNPTYDIVYGDVAISADVNGNVYCLANIQDPGVSIYYLYISKYDTTGAFLWGRTLRTNTNFGRFKIAIDSAFNVIITSTTYDITYAYDIQIAKYNSSGVIQWQQRFFSSPSLQDYARGVTTDLANNVYITGTVDTYLPIVVKYNSSGVLQWQKYISSSVPTANVIDIKSDGTDVYILGGEGGSSAAAYFWKVSSSGTLLWQRKLQINQSTGTYGQVAATNSGDVYFCCGDGISTVPVPAVIAKYNSSGVIQWQRTIGVTDPSERTSGVGAAVDSKSGLLLQLFGSSGVGAGAIMARLPTNGTKTGTYALSTYNVAYTPSTFTESATTYPVGTLVASDVPSSWLDAAFTPTVTNSSLSYIVTQI